jgi:hypothetical protein
MVAEKRKKIPKYIVNPEWAESKGKTVKEMASELMTFPDLQNAYPEDYSLKLPEDGAWIRVNTPPNTLFTVPPFSMWFAVPDPSDKYKNLYRARILTPQGSLWVLPCEYCIIPDIGDFVGMDKEGYYMRFIGDDGGFNADQLFYLRSRGVGKKDAELLLIKAGGLKSQTYCWFECHPVYGVAFGKDWPHPDRCPFAMQVPEKEIEGCIDDYNRKIKKRIKFVNRA